MGEIIIMIIIFYLYSAFLNRAIKGFTDKKKEIKTTKQKYTGLFFSQLCNKKNDKLKVYQAKHNNNNILLE